jgi:hypothetical protein
LSFQASRGRLFEGAEGGLQRDRAQALKQADDYRAKDSRGVLEGWKGRCAYCEAVLRYDRRWNPNGEEVAESVVDERAREMARRRLAAMEARRLSAEKEEAAAARAASADTPRAVSGVGTCSRHPRRQSVT